MKSHPKFITAILYALFVSIFALCLCSCGKSEEESSTKTTATTETSGAPSHGESDSKSTEKGADTPNTINIGIAGAHSGELASYGIPTVNAVTMVVDEFNKKGGLDGKKIKLFTEDDACNPETAADTAAKLTKNKVIAVIGHTCSDATQSAIGIYNDAHIVCISPSATKSELTLSGKYPNFFRAIANDAAQVKLQVDFALHKLHVKKVAILHDKRNYSMDSTTLAKQYFEESGLVTIVIFEGVTSGASDYASIVQKIRQSGADLLVWGGYHPEASAIVKQMRAKKMKTMMMGSDGLKDEAFINSAGKFAEGVYASSPQDASKSILTIKAINDHRSRFGGEPGAFFINAYSAAMALTNAIAKADSTDFDALTKTLKAEHIDTPLGRISFDEHGDIIGSGFSMYQVKGGSFRELK